jgi:hypothetical protein
MMKKFLFLSGWLVIALAFTVTFFNLTCGPALGIGDSIYQKIIEGKGCGPTASGCDGDKLLLCNADHVWELNTDCTDYETPRKCCIIEGKSGCYRAQECEAIK